MPEDHDHLFVVTGGPGSGKTTLIDALEGAGYARTVEAGRGIIQDQVAIGGSALPWHDRQAFAEIMLRREMRSHHGARGTPGPVFCDRGVPDVLGYLRLCGLPIPPHMHEAAEACRYNRSVFIAPPWPEIFTQDSERKQDVHEAERTYKAMAEVYGGLGYALIPLPWLPVADRLQFVVERVATTRTD